MSSFGDMLRLRENSRAGLGEGDGTGLGICGKSVLRRRESKLDGDAQAIAAAEAAEARARSAVAAGVAGAPALQLGGSGQRVAGRAGAGGRPALESYGATCARDARMIWRRSTAVPTAGLGVGSGRKGSRVVFVQAVPTGKPLAKTTPDPLRYGRSQPWEEVFRNCMPDEPRPGGEAGWWPCTQLYRTRPELILASGRASALRVRRSTRWADALLLA